MKVLVLDDEPFVLLEVEAELRDAGFEPVTANCLSRAFDAIDGHRFGAAVLDVNLGRGKTCAPVAERLTELGVPFLLHSGDLDRQGEAISKFGAPVLAKPTPGYRIAEAVAGIVSGSGDAT